MQGLDHGSHPHLLHLVLAAPDDECWAQNYWRELLQSLGRNCSCSWSCWKLMKRWSKKAASFQCAVAVNSEGHSPSQTCCSSVGFAPLTALFEEIAPRCIYISYIHHHGTNWEPLIIFIWFATTFSNKMMSKICAQTCQVVDLWFNFWLAFTFSWLAYEYHVFDDTIN